MVERVFMPAGFFAAAFADHAAQGFAPAGPWQDDDAETWWARGGGEGIRAGISTGIDLWDKALLDRLPQLEEIVVFGAGQAGIDLAETGRRGIRVSSGSVHALDVAEHGAAMILAGWRRLREGDAWVRGDGWQSGRFAMCHRLSGRAVGIVGLGAIGRELAVRMEALGCTVSWWGPNPKPDAPWPRAASLLELARATDILAVAAFAHDDTRNLVSADVIRAIGPEGLLLNVSRGFVVDEDAVIAALHEGALGYAALDVFTEEPTPPERWRDVPNCLLSPHAAGATHESLRLLQADTVARVRRALALGPA